MTVVQALFMGFLQGATELFPVSSLGHAVLVPRLLHWGYRESDPAFVPFLVLLHLGTASALFFLYRREWAGIIRGFMRASLRGRVESAEERLAMLLVVGTVPAGAIGLILDKALKALFANPSTTAAFLIANAAILFGAELLRRRDERGGRQDPRSREQQEASYAQVGQLSFRAATLVGTCQALALLPGISRSGATMAAGLLVGLRHQEAARFSFLLATPIIGAAGLLEAPNLFLQAGVPLGEFLAAAALAGLAAYASARFLLRYFRQGRFYPYAFYCLGLGVVGLLLIH